ncbi:MAG: hypothetical protein JWL79_2613 [Frankiales bacterium]|nr:hypothetical protein [Frankiales bacterium]
MGRTVVSAALLSLAASADPAETVTIGGDKRGGWPSWCS